MKRLYLLFTLFFTLQSFFLFSDTDPEVIGIVFSVKGDLVLENDHGEEEITPGMKVYTESEIRLAKGSGRGKIQIITSQGPVVYSRFPVSFSEAAFASLSDTQQDNYIASIGGTILTERASGGEKEFMADEDVFADESSCADKLFEWYMDPGVLAEEEIKNGFTLVLSRKENSQENLSLNPLYFKIREDVSFTSLSFEIMEDTTFTTVYENGEFTHAGEDLVFLFNCFDYKVDIPYLVDVAITFSPGDTRYWEFRYTIAGKKKIQQIETEAARQYTGTESNFEKDLIRSRVYRQYTMNLQAMQILADHGLDIGDML